MVATVLSMGGSVKPLLAAAHINISLQLRPRVSAIYRGPVLNGPFAALFRQDGGIAYASYAMFFPIGAARLRTFVCQQISIGRPEGGSI